MPTITRTHFYLLVGLLAIGIGALYAAPQFFLYRSLQSEGKPYVVMQLSHHMDELVQYMPRAREVYDGHFPPSDLSQDGFYPSVFPAVPSFLFSVLIRMFVGNIDKAYIAATAIFPALIFLATCAIVYSFTRNRIWSVFVGFAACFTVLFHGTPSAFFSSVGFMNGVAKKFYPFVATILDRYPLARFDDPMLTAPVFLAAFLLLWMLWRDRKTGYAIAGGLAYGLLIYTYLHYWAYLAVVIAVLFAYAWRHRAADPVRFRALCIYIGIILLCAIPFLLNYHSFSALPGIADYVGRIGLERTRMPEIGQSIGSAIFLHYIFYALVGYWAYRRWWSAERARAVFFLACIGAMFFVWNVQVITGFVPHPDHWTKPISIVLLLLLSALVGEFLYRKFSPRILASVLCGGVLLLTAKAVSNAYAISHPPPALAESYTFDRGVVDSWAWMNDHISGEPRVISPSLETSYYLYSYTRARPYLPTAENTVMTQGNLEARYLVSNKLFGVSSDAMISGLHDGDNYRHAFLYYIYYKKHGSDINDVPDEKIKELAGAYSRLAPRWSSIPADYVYVGPNEKNITTHDFARDTDLQSVYRNASVEIFRIKR